jgi:hypothetical protein
VSRLVTRLAIAAAALAGCETPPIKVLVTLTAGKTQQCVDDDQSPTTSCADVSMVCRAVLSVRIVPPDEPEIPYISVCQPLVGAQNKLCAIAGVDLSAPLRPLPRRVLEVQMAVFSRSALDEAGLVDDDGNYICPRVDFAANGFPETSVDCSTGACPIRPAVGGRAFYYPGDDETVVELGCTDLTLLQDDTCAGPPLKHVIATVNDFDTWVPVAGTTGNRLTVSIGEPKGDIDSGFTLTSPMPLARTSSTGVQAWSAELDFDPQMTYCLEVFEDVPQATRSLVCREVSTVDLDGIDVTGALLSKSTLLDILAAKARTTFPEQGLVVGLVLDQGNRPISGARVVPSCLPGKTCTVQYLSADRTSFAPTETSANGIWISEDAPYGTTFSWSGLPLTPAFGGLVQGKVTVVVIQEKAPIGGG